MKNFSQFLTSRPSRMLSVLFIATLMLPGFKATAIILSFPGNPPSMPGPNIPGLLPGDTSVFYSWNRQGSGQGGYSGEPAITTSLGESLITETSHSSVGETYYLDTWFYGTVNDPVCGASGPITVSLETYTDLRIDGTTIIDSGTPGTNPGWLFGDDAIYENVYTYPSGTITVGYSAYVIPYSLEPYCSSHGIMAGSGHLYDIELNITSINAAPTTLPPNPPASTTSIIYPSQDVSTPSGGAFPSGSSFTFDFGGTSGSNYTILSSSNLFNWQTNGTVTLSGTNGSFTDSTVSGITERFYVVQEPGGTYSAPYGFINLSLPAGTNLIGDPLISSYPTITNLIASVPDGTTAQLWNGTDWASPSTFSAGAWDNDALIAPGQAILLDLPSSTSLTFVGEVIQGLVSNAITQGTNAMSSVVPVAGNVALTGLYGAPSIPGNALNGLSNGDSIQCLVGTNYVTYTYNSGRWSPSVPLLNLCEGVLINAATNTTWYIPDLESTPAQQPSTVTSISGTVSGTNLILNWPAIPGVSYNLLSSTNMAGSYTNLATGLTFTGTNGSYTNSLHSGSGYFYEVTNSP